MLELIVVDNNSTDQTKIVVEEFLARLSIWRLVYIFEARQGKQFALNRGIQIATGDVLAFTDDDILFDGKWILEIFSAFHKNDVGLVGGKTIISWEGQVRPAWYDDKMAAVLGGVDLGDDVLAPPPNEYSPAGANLIARREVFDSIGRFDESYFRHMDYEFGQRCIRNNINVCYQPNIIVYAPVDGNVLYKRYFRRWYFKAGATTVMSDFGAAKIIFGVPRWVYGVILKDFFNLLTAAWTLRSNKRFNIELRIWRCFGMAKSGIIQRFKNDEYKTWVERVSQKKNNRY